MQNPETNKANALKFYDEFFNRHDLDAADRYIGDTYIQHNPNVPDGRDAFKAGFKRIFSEFPQRHSTIHRAIAEGDLVALHLLTQKTPDDRGTAIVDIFRFDDAGLIVEHWDVQQPVPETSANQNGMM